MSHTVTFIKEDLISFMIPIGRGKTAAEQAQNSLVEKANRGRLIKFRHMVPTGIGTPRCSFTTDNPLILRFLTDWNKRNNHVLKADLSLVPLKCHQCDFTTADGSAASHQELAIHTLEVHQSLEEDEANEELFSLDADGKLENPDKFKLVDLKQIAIDAGGDEDVVSGITSKQGVVDYIREIVPTAETD